MHATSHRHPPPRRRTGARGLAPGFVRVFGGLGLRFVPRAFVPRAFVPRLALCVGLALPAAAPASTLVFCAATGPVAFQPALSTDQSTANAVAHTLYDRLLDFKPDSTELVPALASSWEVSADGLRYTFHLRDGVAFQSNATFHPTRALNADDVVFSFRRMLDRNHPYHAVSGGTYSYFASMELDRLIAAVDRVDDRTVRFTLSQPSAPFLSDLAMDFASIDSAEYAAQLAAANRKQDLDLKPIGTGAFQLAAFVPASQVRYKAFDAHWRGRPKIDNLVFAITPDASVRWAKLRAGECQAMEYPATSDLPAMRADPAVRVLSAPGLNTVYLGLNVEHPPLQDARVRRALELATDRKAIADAVFGSDAVPAVNPIPPAMWSYDGSIAPYPHDPAAARQLLAEAGYPDGFDTDIWTVSVGQGLMRDPRRIVVMIQSNWADIGVRARVVTYESGEYLKRLGHAEHSSALMAWVSDNGDPDNFLAILLSCHGVHTAQNLSEYCSRPFDALMQRARASSDPAQRADLYRQGQQMFHAELPFLPLMHVNETMAISRRVHGFRQHATGGVYFQGVSLD
jgi:dipeptide transport system substrate-binding protein